MNDSSTHTDAAVAYRDLNRTLLLVLSLVLTWVLSTHVLAMVLGRPVHTCASRTFLSMPCPLCGVTRGIAALVRGDLHRATAYNPLSAPIALALLAELGYRALGTWRLGARRLAHLRTADARLHGLALAAFLGYAIGFYLNLLMT